MSLKRYGLVAALSTAILMAGYALSPAAALEPVCLSNRQSEGFDNVVQSGVTRAVPQQQAANTWDDWIWRGDQEGESYVCNETARNCEYKWDHTVTTRTNWSIGGAVLLGNHNNPVKEGSIAYLNMFLVLIPTYGETTEYTTDFNQEITFRPGDTAYPIQVATRRWRSGYYQGGYFKMDPAEGCSTAAGESGHWYFSSRDRIFGSWTDNHLEQKWSTYVVNGQAMSPPDQG